MLEECPGQSSEAHDDMRGRTIHPLNNRGVGGCDDAGSKHTKELVLPKPMLDPHPSRYPITVQGEPFVRSGHEVVIVGATAYACGTSPYRWYGRVACVSRITRTFQRQFLKSNRYINTLVEAMKKYALNPWQSSIANRGQEARRETCMKHSTHIRTSPIYVCSCPLVLGMLSLDIASMTVVLHASDTIPCEVVHSSLRKVNF